MNRCVVCSLGGILLTARDGSIRCNNTLDLRLQMSCEDLLPAVRTTLFGTSKTRVHFT